MVKNSLQSVVKNRVYEPKNYVSRNALMKPEANKLLSLNSRKKMLLADPFEVEKKINEL
jgi:hypothetical protein